MQYETNYIEVIDSLNQKYVDRNIYGELLTALKDNKNQIINITRNYQHYNLRTYIFFLSVLKRICNIYPDKLVLNELIGFIFETSIRFKTEQEQEDDLNIYANFVSDSKVKELVKDLMYRGITDLNSSRELLKRYSIDLKANIINSDDSLYILIHWDEYSNKEIQDALIEIENSIESRNFNADTCSKIILYTCHLYENVQIIIRQNMSILRK